VPPSFRPICDVDDTSQLMLAVRTMHLSIECYKQKGASADNLPRKRPLNPEISRLLP
jgi:hypothetical protein